MRRGAVHRLIGSATPGFAARRVPLNTIALLGTASPGMAALRAARQQHSSWLGWASLHPVIPDKSIALLSVLR